ncbi:MAG TPA: glycosyl hydrolase [Planctomycetaceae bacterium]|nr:glycosyl hydrolase [Planctomycetaceae bacterium]
MRLQRMGDYNVKEISKSLSEMGADPLEASRFHSFFGLAGEGQAPFRIGLKIIFLGKPMVFAIQTPILASWLFVSSCVALAAQAFELKHAATPLEVGISQARIEASLETDAFASPGQIVVVYFTPNDRPPAKDHTARIRRIVEAAAKFYQDELKRHGFDGRTMKVLRNPKGEVQVMDVVGQFPDRQYGKPDGPKIRDEIIPVLRQAEIDPQKSVLLMFCNLMDYDPDASTISHHSPYYGSGSHLAGNAWQCDSEILDPRRLTDSTKLRDGQYGDITIGKHNSIFLGGVIHELGHALSLPHCRQREDEAVRGTALMGSGNRTYGEELRGEGRGTFLTQAHALRLAAHPAFNPRVPASSATVPRVDWGSMRVFAMPNKRIRISGDITSDVSIHGVVAYFDPAGGGDYDATTATAVPNESGHFELESCDLPIGSGGQVRIVTCHTNGATTTKEFAYKFDAKDNLDLSLARIEWELAGLIDALEAGDLGLAVRTLEQLASGDEELALIGSRILGRFTDRATGPKANAIDLSTIDESTKAIPLSAIRPANASVGWQSPAYDRLGDTNRLLSVGGDYFARGIYAHAPARHEYLLDGNWNLLSGRCGLLSGLGGKVDFEIVGDGRRLWNRNGVVDGEAVEFDIDVHGIQVLKLIVNDGGNGKTADHALWIEPKLSR